MPRRQTVPRQWLVADARLGEDLWNAIRRLPRESGVLFLYCDLAAGQRARLLKRVRAVARSRGLLVLDEAAGEARRVHDAKELRRAALAGVPIVFLSPVFSTRSHTAWQPLNHQRVSALLRLSQVPVIALGGMTGRRFRTVKRLGFSGWAGMDAWLAGRTHGA